MVGFTLIYDRHRMTIIVHSVGLNSDITYDGVYTTRTAFLCSVELFRSEECRCLMLLRARSKIKKEC